MVTAAGSQYSSVQSQKSNRSQHTPNTQPTSSNAQGVLDKYETLAKIGEGTYGVVYLAWSKEPPRRLYAIKTFKTGREGDGISPTAIREIMLLRELHHENIVRLDSVHIDRQEPSLSLAFDYAEHDLYEMIRYHRDKLRAPLDPAVIKSVMFQLLNGLSYLHQNWIIHRDLKPSNVLVMGEGEGHGVVKIADFGLARIFQSPVRPLSDNGVVVTIWYRAPELLLGAKHYTRAVDIWAAGCIFGELLTLKPLFQGQEKKQVGNPYQSDQVDKIFRILGHPNPRNWTDLEHLQHWKSNEENVRTRRPEYLANRLEDYLLETCKNLSDAARVPYILKPRSQAVALLQRMLEYDPAKRITAEEALKHEYFCEEPLPSSNVFVQNKRIIAHYPQRIKYTGGGASGQEITFAPQGILTTQTAHPTIGAAIQGNMRQSGSSHHGHGPTSQSRKRKAEHGVSHGR